MKKFILNLIIVAYCSATGLAQQKLLLSDVSTSFRVGDSIRYDLVDIDNFGRISLYEPVWDFSNLKYLGQESKITLISGDSGNVRMIGQDEMLDFKQTTDSQFLSQIQTALVKIDFGDTFSYLRYPFSVKDSLVCVMDGQGIYSSKNKFRLKGKSKVKAMGLGKIILPDDESLSNTLLVKWSVSGDILPAKNNSELVHNVGKLHLMVEDYEWFSKGYRYPVFKVLQASLKNGGQEIMHREYACVANMDSFEMLDDAENEKLRVQQQGENVKDKKSSPLINYQVTMSGRQLHIAYSLTLDSQLRFVLSNTSGMILKSFNQHQSVGNGYRQVIELGDLPRGEYVLYINVNNQRLSEKVSVE